MNFLLLAPFSFCLQLHKMEKENLEMHTALERLQLELRDANERAASAVAMDFASGSSFSPT